MDRVGRVDRKSRHLACLGTKNQKTSLHTGAAVHEVHLVHKVHCMESDRPCRDVTRGALHDPRRISVSDISAAPIEPIAVLVDVPFEPTEAGLATAIRAQPVDGEDVGIERSIGAAIEQRRDQCFTSVVPCAFVVEGESSDLVGCALSNMRTRVRRGQPSDPTWQLGAPRRRAEHRDVPILEISSDAPATARWTLAHGPHDFREMRGMTEVPLEREPPRRAVAVDVPAIDHPIGEHLVGPSRHQKAPRLSR